MKDTFRGRKIEYDPHFEWMVDRIVKDTPGLKTDDSRIAPTNRKKIIAALRIYR